MPSSAGAAGDDSREAAAVDGEGEKDEEEHDHQRARPAVHPG